jgi:hypothetical protein
MSRLAKLPVTGNLADLEPAWQRISGNLAGPIP